MQPDRRHTVLQVAQRQFMHAVSIQFQFPQAALAEVGKTVREVFRIEHHQLSHQGTTNQFIILRPRQGR